MLIYPFIHSCVHISPLPGSATDNLFPFKSTAVKIKSLCHGRPCVFKTVLFMDFYEQEIHDIVARIIQYNKIGVCNI